MRTSPLAAAFAAGSLPIFAALALAASETPRGPRAQDFTLDRVDANQVSMFVSNFGQLSYDFSTGAAGLEYPKGSGHTAMFDAGLWLGGMAPGGLRIAQVEYTSEQAPGAAPAGVPESPLQPALKVYKLLRTYSDAATRDAALNDYLSGAVSRGAPAVHVQADGSLDIVGDQMLWAVYNDLDPQFHHAEAGGTPPLGVEVQQTVYAFDRPGSLGRTVLLSFKILNRSGGSLQGFYAGLWCDPDLGDFADDLVGCEPARSLGYCYNGGAPDAVYGAAPPAIGCDLLRVSRIPSGAGSTGATSFIKYTNGTDPKAASQTYAFLQGLQADGTPIVDPTTGQTTKFMHAGDPRTGTGWLDSAPSDRRFLLASGPFDLAAGEGLQFDAAIVIGQGADRLSSITALEQADDEVQTAFENGFVGCAPVAMGFDFQPNTLNLRSMGRWVTGFLEPPAPYEPSDIDVPSVRLNDVVPVDPAAPTAIGDHDGDGRPDLMVKFDRQAVEAALPQGTAVPVQVTGSIGDGCFAGGTQARTIRPAVTAPVAGGTYSAAVVTPVQWTRPAEASPRWVALLHSIDGGESWALDAKYLPNYGSAGWTVPYVATDHAKVAVVLVESADESGDQVEGLVGLGPSFRIAAPTGVGDDAPGLALLGTFPSPARGPLRLDFRLPDAATATLTVHDLAGRLMWRQEVGALGPGSHRLEVDGRRLPAGVYLVRLRHGAERRSMRVVLVE